MSAVQKSKDSIRTSHRLASNRLLEWLAAPVFAFADDPDRPLSREAVCELTHSPCIRATQNLDRILRRYHIRSLKQLELIGLDGLLRCHGIGERSAWVAGLILYEFGRDVEAWMNRTPTAKQAKSWKAKIRLVHDATRKQKHG